MSIKTKLLTSVAVLSISAAPVFAEEHTAANTEATGEANAQTELSNGRPLGWNDDLDRQYADIADRPVRDLVGMNVISENGEDVGEVDTFVIMEGNLMAVVGVGGFLGLGEHDVALSLSDLTWDGQRLVIPFTEAELEAMPEWDEQADFTALAEDDTFRTRTMPQDDTTDMAATEETDDGVVTLTGDGEQMAETEDGAVEQEAEELAADAEAATEEAGEEVADAAEATENAVEEGAAEAEQMAENAATETEQAAEAAGEEVAELGEATENAVEEGAAETEQMAENAATETEQAAEAAGEEVAEAAEATENAVEEGAAEAEQMAENAATETEQAAEAAGEEVAEAAEATENAVEEGAAEAEQMAENAAAEAGSWFEEIEAVFGELTDAEIREIEGMEVVNAQGDVIGEIDDIAMHNGAPIAIVGVGGFIGLGEHDVAIDLAQLQRDGERFVLDGYTEEDLKQMPEVDHNTVEMLDDDVTLRSQANM